jgi:antitoxin component YwqK of YwqJK toxin-antitoxin module
MKKLLLVLLFVFLNFACSSDEKIVLASSLETKDGIEMYMGTPFDGYAAYRGKTKYVKGYAKLRKGDVCKLLLKYENGNVVGMKEFNKKPTKEILIENSTYDIGTELINFADEKNLTTYKDGKIIGKIQINWDGLWLVLNGEGVIYNTDGSIKSKLNFKDGKKIN